jgi:hypothetical protein
MKRTWMARMTKIAAVAVAVATLGGLLAACGSSATATPIPTTDVGRSICATYFGSTASVAARFHIPTPVTNKDYENAYVSNGQVLCNYRTTKMITDSSYKGPEGILHLGVLYGSAKQAVLGFVVKPSGGIYVQDGQVGAWAVNVGSPYTAAQKAWLKNTVLPRVAPPPSS